jgi:hypothetical protein
MMALNGAQPDPYAVLLKESRCASLPTPTPLDLAEVPLVRAAWKLERPGPDGTLPTAAYVLRHEVRGPNGVSYQVTVTGSPQEGLPYGRDGDVLQALFRIAASRGASDGVLEGVSFREIGRAMGLSDRRLNAEDTRRIRGALSRFGHIIITARTLHRAEELAGEIIAGVPGRHPVQPDLGLRPRESEEKLNLLSYRRATSFQRSAGGEDVIEHLSIQPRWISQMVSGWVSWIDTDLYCHLAKPTSKRLYEIVAARAARGEVGPVWKFDLETLWSSCALQAGQRPSRVRDQIIEAASPLVESGVLASAEWESRPRGGYRILLAPGIVLGAAAHLRGAGALDQREARVLLMALSRFGITGRVARGLVLEQPNRAYWALCRAVYLSENPAADGVRETHNWAGRILTWVRDGWANEGDESFQRWHASSLAAHREVRPGLKKAPAVALPQVVETAPVLPPPPGPPVPPDASDAWSALLSSIEAGGNRMLRATLGQVWPQRLEEGSLLCVTPSDLHARMLAKHEDALARALVEATEGRTLSLRVTVVR